MSVIVFCSAQARIASFEFVMMCFVSCCILYSVHGFCVVSFTGAHALLIYFFSRTMRIQDSSVSAAERDRESEREREWLFAFV